MSYMNVHGEMKIVTNSDGKKRENREEIDFPLGSIPVTEAPLITAILMTTKDTNTIRF